MSKVLVVSCHPDDETLGAGGTLLKHIDNGDLVFWLNITNVKEEYGFSKTFILDRTNQIAQVIKNYKIKEFFDLSLRPSFLSYRDIPYMINKVNDIFDKVKPEILYLPFYADAHSDHRLVFQAFQPFLKSFRYPFIKRVLMMEVISETDNQFLEAFKPNVFVDITNYIEKKLKIMSNYESELAEHPFPRNLENIRNLAFYRGSQCNCKYAESFMLLKEVIY